MDDASPEEMKESIDAWNAFDHAAIERGVFIACEPLEDSSKTTTIRVDDGERIVTDGPFAETKEQLGGFCLLECASRAEALEWGHKVPMTAGVIEVRPILDLSQFGYESKTVSAVAATA